MIHQEDTESTEKDRGKLVKSLVFAVLLALAATLSAQTIPHTEAETLSGKKIALPDAAAGHPAILIVAFSRAGGDASGRWNKQLRQQFGSNQNLHFYSVAVLQDAPKLVRGMIRHGMRGSIPQNEQDSFALLYKDEDVWKKLVDFSEADDAYVLLADSTGKVHWHTHGKASDQEEMSALRNELGKITKSNP
jgi:ATP10 protein